MDAKKIINRKNWTKSELDFLKEIFPDTPTKIIASELNRNYSAIANKAILLGLKKSQDYKDRLLVEQSKQLNEHAYGRFRKGDVPHNKGKKMTVEMYEIAKKTMFQKGCLPHNTCKDWQEVLRKQKSGKQYYMIKLPTERRLIFKHIYIWEGVNGKVPKGYNIVFKNGDTLNCEYENLECISDAELMSRNTINNYPTEIVKTIIILNKFKNKLKKHERTK